MPLTDEICRTCPQPEKLVKLSDGGGLQLWLMPSGSRLWRLAYRTQGKQKVLSIGAYPAIGLSEARAAREAAKKALQDGHDPADSSANDGTSQNSETTGEPAATVTFGEIADEYFRKLACEQVSEATMKKKTWLLGLVERRLRQRPIEQITVPEIWQALRDVEVRGIYHSVHRLRALVGAIFRYAVATGRAAADPTPCLRGALIRHRSRSYAAITSPEALGALLRAIDGYQGQIVTAVGLKLMVLLFPRPGELRRAQWTEFDRTRQVWTIPAHRMKMRRIHAVPLSSQAIGLLDHLHRITGHRQLVFPSIRSAERPMSENTLNAALRRLGYTRDEMLVHGFRATASTLLNESGKWHPDAIERQLAHIDGNAVRRVYARGDFWEERVRMMQWWADFLDELRNCSPRRDTTHDTSGWTQSWPDAMRHLP